MRLGSNTQEWKWVESLICTPEHCFTVALQPRASIGCVNGDGVHDAGRGCINTWVHIYTIYLYCMSPSPSVCVSEWCLKLCVRVCVCVLYPLPRETGLLSKLDSVIGSSENPNEAISISAAAPLPAVPAQPTGRPPALPVQTSWEVRRDGIRKAKDSSELQTRLSHREGDCGKTSWKIQPDHKWWWQIIVKAVCVQLKSDATCLNS